MKPRIPKGWRRVPERAPVRHGDRSWEGTAWATIELLVDLREPVMRHEIVIRRKDKQ